MSKIKYFSTDEIRNFFQAVTRAKSVRDMLFFSLVYHYGLRLGEATGLKLEDLTESGQILIRRLKGGTPRTFDMSIEDRKLLNRWLRKREKYPNAANNEYLFITSRSGPDHLSQSMAKKLHTKYCDLGGINSDKRCNIHAWRHSTAIQLLMKGYDINFVKHYMGHRSLQSTLVYAELMPPEWTKLSKKAVETAFSI